MPGARGDDGGDRVDRRHRRHDVAQHHEVRERLGVLMKSGGGRKPSFTGTVGRPSMVIVHPPRSSSRGRGSGPCATGRSARRRSCRRPGPASWPRPRPRNRPRWSTSPSSTSSVVCAYSASHTISSSSTPSASATMAHRLAEHRRAVGGHARQLRVVDRPAEAARAARWRASRRGSCRTPRRS